ncbi:MAG: PQQ-dependent sugar dehydrogenase [Labrys sp. (in: a-proteobacteria)]|jgi:glucose/arabinose dehydrogenase
MNVSRSVLVSIATAFATTMAFTVPVFAEPIARIGDIARVEVVAGGLEHPWGLAFLPDGRMLVTERPGRLRIVAADGTVSPPVEGVPTVDDNGQGGLLDVALDPAFAQNGLVYLSFSEPGEGGSGTSVARGRLDGTTLRDVGVIYRQTPKVGGGRHFGSRLVFAPDGTLFVTQGDRGSMSESAQDLATTIGKVVRIKPDGSIPADNPFIGRSDARAEIWSYGHRNAQGATIDPATGLLWTVEHGARGGDELNQPQAGRNYGWPVITYGRDYSGEKIGVGTTRSGLEQPVYYWDPSIAPSGLTFYTGDAIPAWKGSLFLGALAGQRLVRLTLREGKVTGEEVLLADLGERIRDVVEGPDGFLYLLTDSDDGRVLRIRP